MTAFVVLVLMLFLALLTVADLLPALAGPPALRPSRGGLLATRTPRSAGRWTEPSERR
jgi:hypothetical protein